MMNLLAAMSGGAEEERAPSRAGSIAPSASSGRTPEWAYATEALSAEMKAGEDHLAQKDNGYHERVKNS